MQEYLDASEKDLPASMTFHSEYTLYFQHLDDEYEQVKKEFCFKNCTDFFLSK